MTAAAKPRRTRKAKSAPKLAKVIPFLLPLDRVDAARRDMISLTKEALDRMTYDADLPPEHKERIALAVRAIELAVSSLSLQKRWISGQPCKVINLAAYRALRAPIGDARRVQRAANDVSGGTHG